MKGKFNYYCVKFGSQGSVPATPSGMLQPDTQRKSGRQRYHTISCRCSPPPSLAAIYYVTVTTVPICHFVAMILLSVSPVIRGRWRWRESTPVLA